MLSPPNFKAMFNPDKMKAKGAVTETEAKANSKSGKKKKGLLFGKKADK